MRAFYDNNLLEKAQFAVASFLMVRDMDVMVWMKNGQKFDLQDRIETTKVYAKEVEHSEENIEMLGESFLFEDVFSVRSTCTDYVKNKPGDRAPDSFHKLTADQPLFSICL